MMWSLLHSILSVPGLQMHGALTDWDRCREGDLTLVQSESHTEEGHDLKVVSPPETPKWLYLEGSAALLGTQLHHREYQNRQPHAAADVRNDAASKQKPPPESKQERRAEEAAHSTP